MKCFILAMILSSAGFAQIPGLGAIKDKLSGTNSKVAPVTDRAQRAVDTFTPWTAEEEQDIGLAGAEKMVAIFGLVDDPALEKYVNLVGLSVAQFASRDLPWRFGVLNTNMVGAFALPGGYVFVTKGSLSGITNEAQLGGVLGHEIEHAAARHLESEIRGKKTSSWAVEEGLAKTKGPAQLKSRADALVKDLFSTSLSRAKENDADEQGSRMTARAGYAGSGLMEFLKIASMASADPANKRFFGQLLSTHPSFPDRIAHLSSLDSARAKGKTLDARYRKAVGR
jgi:predicted Zn-dependent protease